MLHSVNMKMSAFIYEEKYYAHIKVPIKIVPS
jgi:hypothetical protein